MLPGGGSAGASASEASIINRKDARTITLSIPAPRGPILDRNGDPIAQNRVTWQVALQFEQFEKNDRDFVVRWARERLVKTKALLKGVSDFTDDQLWNHYLERRWLPLYISSHLGVEEKKKIESQLPKGVILYPVYQRYYPEGDLAAHIIGYTGSVGKLPTGPINFNEPLWEETEGRAGLEKLFNNDLQGQAGMKKLLFDEQGRKLLEEQVKRPRPGGAVVTTLNLKWQRQAEKALRQNAHRGALVVIDVNTGEVLVMASRPSFDLNRFIPGIGQAEYKALEDDPSAPLFARAFQSAYPPGSTFKPVVALTALHDGTVDEHTEIYCPASITLGGHTFNNHNHKAAGNLDVKHALALSNNPWFYQVGMKVGPNAFLATARNLGYGEKTGLPLIGETTGLVPTNEWMLANEKRPFMDGDSCNLAIGQGVLLASPLQVAQGMAGIANGGVLPKLHLIHQLQDTYGRVTRQAMPERRKWLGLDSNSIEIVHEGMRDVVNSGYGTGRGGSLGFTKLCAKTGTSQWTGDRRLAWFAGFLPFDEPRFAFAAVYEGKPGERPSGGKNAAPIITSFFEPLEDDLKELLAPAPKALEIEDDGETPKARPVKEAEAEEGVVRALPVEELETDGDTENIGALPAIPVEGDGDEDGEE